MSEDKRTKLKESISQKGVRKAVDILPDGTLVDGYNRYRIVEELKAETGKLKSNVVIESYRVPQTVLPMMSLQEAKEYSIEINLARRHLNEWQTAKWAIEVYNPKNFTEREIASKAGLGLSTINRCISLLNNLHRVYRKNSQKAKEYESKLQNGEIGVASALRELQSGENFDKAIAEIKDADFQEEMTAKYADSKYKPTTIKKLEKDITVHEHPERFTDEQKYYELAKKFVTQGKKAEEKYEDNIAIMTIGVPEDYKECNKWITQQAKENRGFTCVCFFYLPSDMREGKP